MTSVNPAHQFMSYDGTHMETLPNEAINNMYNLISYELTDRVRQIKLINVLQNKLMALTEDARAAMIQCIKGYLKNEVNNLNNMNTNDLSSMTLLFNTYGSDDFWSTFYSNHSKNSMVAKIVHFVG